MRRILVAIVAAIALLLTMGVSMAFASPLPYQELTGYITREEWAVLIIGGVIVWLLIERSVDGTRHRSHSPRKAAELRAKYGLTHKEY